MTCSRTSKPGLVHHVTGEGDCYAKAHRRSLASQQPDVDSALARLISTHRSVSRSNGASRCSRPSPRRPKPPTPSRVRVSCESLHINTSANASRASPSLSYHLAGSSPRLTCGCPRSPPSRILKTVRDQNPRVLRSSRWDNPKVALEPFVTGKSNQTLKWGAFALSVFDP